MTLRERAVDLVELMDDPSCDTRRLDATYRRFGLVNRAVSGWGAVYRRALRPALRRMGRPAHVLDIGSGGGDVIARLSRLADKDGLDVRWTGSEPEPRALRASERHANDRIRFVPGDSRALRDAGERFDIVLSNHVLHHLDPAGLQGFAEDSLALSRELVLHADIERGRRAYALWSVGSLPLAPGTFLRIDGLRSIRRSYRSEELAAALGTPWRVVRPAPFRLLAMAHGRG